MQFLVEDGCHVYSGPAYAEIEVMKMVMTLTTQESGVVHHIKRSGAVLEAGSILARLDLDDPTRVHRAELYTKGFDSLDEDSMCLIMILKFYQSIDKSNLF